MKTLTVEWLQEKGACQSGMDWFTAQKERNPVKVIRKLMVENHFSRANWLIVWLMADKQYASYVVFAAEQVLPIYENKYPADKRPRQAIEAAKKYIASPTAENRTAAWAAGDAAWVAKLIHYGIELLTKDKP